MKKVFKKIRFPKMSLFLAIAFLAAGFFPSMAAGMHISAGPDEQEIEAGIQSLAVEMKPEGMSIAPILAFDSTFGTVFGAALFLSKPEKGYDLATKVNATTQSDLALFLDYRKWSETGYFYRLEVSVDGFAIPYYGEGSDTNEADEVRIDQTAVAAKFHLNYRENSKVKMGLFLDLRFREELSVDGVKLTPPLFPDESRLGFGYSLAYDTRDSSISPTKGTFQRYSLLYLPKFTTNLDSAETFIQAELDFRGFYSFNNRVTLAGRVNAGTSWVGEPTYLYRYSLGGKHSLRGYFHNRFRGKKFYLAQGEVRFPLFWVVTGAAFVDVGDVTDSEFASARTTFGGGIRFLLPPDYIAKVRCDYGIGEDQESIYFVFAEAF